MQTYPFSHWSFFNGEFQLGKFIEVRAVCILSHLSFTGTAVSGTKFVVAVRALWASWAVLDVHWWFFLVKVHSWASPWHSWGAVWGKLLPLGARSASERVWLGALGWFLVPWVTNWSAKQYRCVGSSSALAQSITVNLFPPEIRLAY